VLKVTPAIKKLINANATADDIQKQAEAEGMVTMLEDGFIKAAQGLLQLKRFCASLLNKALLTASMEKKINRLILY